MERYEKQIKFQKLGEEGQRKLLASKVAIVGMGALGCAAASELTRAGVGFLRLIDGDSVSLLNLHRQILFTEEDASKKVPKVSAAKDRLSAANSDVQLETVSEYLNEDNCSVLLSDVDLVIDASDNMEARYLINQFCVNNKLPWIYGGVAGSQGMSANFLPGGPCFSCFTKTDMTVQHDCRTDGVLNTLPVIIASYQASEAIKILTGSENVRKELLFLDIWENEQLLLKMEKDPDCPVCGK